MRRLGAAGELSHGSVAACEALGLQPLKLQGRENPDGLTGHCWTEDSGLPACLAACCPSLKLSTFDRV